LSAGLLVLLAIPALGLHIAKPSDEALAGSGEPALRALADVRRAFPGAGAPAVVVVTAPPSKRAAVSSRLMRLPTLPEQKGLTHPPFDLTVNTDRTAAALFLPLAGNGGNETSKRALRVLRTELIPRTLGTVTGVRTVVTGDTAEDVDFTAQMRNSVPY